MDTLNKSTIIHKDYDMTEIYKTLNFKCMDIIDGIGDDNNTGNDNDNSNVKGCHGVIRFITIKRIPFKGK